MTSGVGRGRGWLNINKNAQNPGCVPSPTLQNPNEAPSPSTSISHQTNSQPYGALISIIGQLNDSDDGILLNQKLQTVTQTWMQECSTGLEVEESFKSIYQLALQDSIFAMKLVTMIASYTFTSKDICQVRIRSLFIGNLQQNFENCKHLQSSNPVHFRNVVRMHGIFYHKARFSDGAPIKLLLNPFLHYLDLLLESTQLADLELFTTQLYLNGTAIKAEFPQKINDILIQVRYLLINNSSLTTPCKIWLLLAIDAANNRFGILPTELNSFYQQQLGDKAMATLQGSLSALSVQTVHNNKTFDNYKSNVSVLQVSPQDSSSAGEVAPSLTNNQNPYKNSDSIKWDGQGESKIREKAGRPILGAGARLKENSSRRDMSKDSSEGKQNSTGNSGWGSKKKANKSGPRNKSWEHDDRFESDYN